jgi:hypothetical protein
MLVAVVTDLIQIRRLAKTEEASGGFSKLTIFPTACFVGSPARWRNRSTARLALTVAERPA